MFQGVCWWLRTTMSPDIMKLHGSFTLFGLVFEWSSALPICVHLFQLALLLSSKKGFCLASLSFPAQLYSYIVASFTYAVVPFNILYICGQEFSYIHELLYYQRRMHISSFIFLVILLWYIFDLWFTLCNLRDYIVWSVIRNACVLSLQCMYRLLVWCLAGTWVACGSSHDGVGFFSPSRCLSCVTVG